MKAWIDDEIHNHRRDEQFDTAGWVPTIYDVISSRSSTYIVPEPRYCDCDVFGQGDCDECAVFRFDHRYDA